MAAYAALVSLENLMSQIQNHTRLSISIHKQQIESLSEKVSFLQEFMVKYSHIASKEAKILEIQIASAAYAVEDVIESHIVDQIRDGSISLLDLQKVIEEMDCIKDLAMKFIEKKDFRDFLPTHSFSANNFKKSLAVERDIMVGFDEKLIRIMDELTAQQSSRRIVSIVGMGGIGKTTLARNVYENPLIVQKFHIRAWVTVSQHYSVKEILLKLLIFQREQHASELDRQSEYQLGEKLYKILSGKRYLIILDDMWSLKAWDMIKKFFPDNNNGCRIVVTTRLTNVAVSFGSSCLEMNLLNEKESWRLFCEMVFAEEGCAPELVEIGKEIARKCKGLPLSIAVIGGLLGKSNRRRELWENVAKDINSIINSAEDEHCLDILYLSYNHLPVHLKPCFLYMGIFPEDYDIRVSRLIKLWVAEGFLKPSATRSLEEVAEDYVRDLVDRNLIFVRRLGSNGKIKTCNIHDLLRDLCLKVAGREKFLFVMRVLKEGSYEELKKIRRCVSNERRIIFHESIPKKDHDLHLPVFHALNSASFARSLICEGGQLPHKFRLLRVLTVVDDDSLETIFRQVNLRYLSYEHLLFSYTKLPSSISLLWNVQTIIIRGGVNHIFAPREIWALPQIRHLEIDMLCLPNPLHPQQDEFVLLNLKTLSDIINFRWSIEVCKKIPNVRKLCIWYDGDPEKCEATSYYYCLHNLCLLHKLESLKCSFPARMHNLKFPSSLKKLVLKGSRLQWKDLTMIGSLPYLEVLKLEIGSVTGPEWNPVEGEFARLKMLKIHCIDLIYWNADDSHFPFLEELALRCTYELKEIPSGIGEIPTLKLISLYYCSESSVISAMRIVEEQESLGNEGLRVRVEFWDEVKLESFRAKVELDSFTSDNFQVRATL